MQGKVEISGVNTAKLKTLSNEEMMHLIELAQAGDEQAKQKLVEGNLKLVLSVIQRFMGRGGKSGRSVSGGVHRAVKSDCRILIRTKAGPLFDLRRADDCRRAPPVSARLQPHPRQPFGARHRLPGAAVQAGAGRQRTGASRRMEEIAQQRWTFRWKRSSARWTRLPRRCPLYEPVYSDGGDPLTVMDQVRDIKNTDERWLDSIAIRQAISAAFGSGKNGFWRCGFMTAGRRWRLPASIGISQAQVSRLEKNALSAIRRAISVS